MKRICLMLVLLGIAFASTGTFGIEAKPVNQLCPVMPDEQVDPTIFVTYRGRRVQFCCKRCRKKFLENPVAYEQSLAQAGDEDVGHKPALRRGESVDAAGVEHEPVADNHEGATVAEHQEDEAHNHATGHGQAESLGRVVRFLGKFHPLAIHFPIALVMAAALAEILALWSGRGFFADAARFGIVLGAFGAAAAVPLGWAAAAFEHYPDELAFVLTLHRWVGSATGLLIVATCILSEMWRRLAIGRFGLAYRVLLFVSAGMVGLTGFLGGSLIYGLDHLTW